MSETNTATKTTTMENQTQDEKMTPIFSEISEITHDGALNILIQAAGQAQAAGALTVRDSVLVAKAIDTVRPGSI
ncbi:hypothetical protein N8Z10_00775 [bacterium]|nr:hypothetical protein [bacterium]